MADEPHPSPDESTSDRGPRRMLLAPEVVQTSAMDCGPAALKCVLEGFGISVSYGRLREACQTSVDGTSIDTIEQVASLLGLDAEQILSPVEHVAAPGAGTLPAIAVVSLPSGLSHFVVLWRRIGPYLQVMDPARGRRWVRVSELARDLYVHTQPVDGDAFHSFAVDTSFTHPLVWRLGRVTGRRGAALLEPTVHAAVADPSWHALARIDGATRAAESLIAAGILKRGRTALRLIRALLDGKSDATDTGPDRDVVGDAGHDVVDLHACARVAPGDDGAVLVQGAVLVRIVGRRARDDGSSGVDADAAIPRELSGALTEERAAPWRALVRLWTVGARRAALAALVLVALAAVGTIAEVVLARPLLSGDAGAGAGAGLPVLLAVVVGLLALELPLAVGAQALGRALDQGLRRAFLRKLPRLGDRYFASRPVSDMAERAHLLHRVRLLPGVTADLARAMCELVLMTAAIVWLYPGGARVAIALLAAAFVLPVLGVPALAERDLRLRTHSGSLMRFYLDALLGQSAVRTHRAERAVAREHDDRLVEWRRAGRDLIRTALTVESAAVTLSSAGAAVLVLGFLRDGPSSPARAGAALLLLFLALGLPGRAAGLVALARQFPEHRNVTLRLIEPLGAPEERAASGAPANDDTDEGAAATARASQAARTSRAPDAEAPLARARAVAVAIDLDGLHVEAGGRPVLTDVSLSVPRGAHVAVVGASGSGKSTLLGVLLGFYPPAAGHVSIDGRAMTAADLVALRADTVWIEPGVQLWNRSLADNVAYGAGAPPPSSDVARALASADLSRLVSHLPLGVDTPLGEGGGLVSGGEGQRVRLARELIRVPRPRLVLLDEPFRGLDRTTRARLLVEARARWADATIVVVTHDVDQTRDFARVLVVDGGRIVEDGDPRALAADASSRYHALLAAEASVHERRWSAPFWRRLTVRDGRVWGEEPPA